MFKFNTGLICALGEGSIEFSAPLHHLAAQETWYFGAVKIESCDFKFDYLNI